MTRPDTASFQLAVELPANGRTVDALSAYLANNAVFNPMDFGAIGDGVANDYTPLQNCLNAAGAVTGTVLLPHGKSFRYTTTPSVPQLVSIVGEGYGSLLIADGCDGLAYQKSNGMGPQVASNFQLLGNTTTKTAIRYDGTVNTADKLTGATWDNLLISGFFLGFNLRGVWLSRIQHCALNNVYNGILVRGQTVKLTIFDNNILKGSATGAGAPIGLQVVQTADYDPGASTIHRPEDIKVSKNMIYNFDILVDHVNCLFASYIDNDLDQAAVGGIRYSQSDGSLIIRDNWIALTTGGTGQYGIQSQALGSPSTGHVIIEGNNISSLSTYSLAAGVNCGASNQRNTDIVRNAFSGFLGNDIIAQNLTNFKIRDNSCQSGAAGVVTSIYVNSCTDGDIDGNNTAGPLFVHPSSNSNLRIGTHGGWQSTLIRGKAIIIAGTTSKTVTYTSLPGSPPNFIVGGTSFLGAKVAYVTAVNPATAGSEKVWASSVTDSQIVVNSGAAPAADLEVRFEVRTFPANA